MSEPTPPVAGEPLKRAAAPWWTRVPLRMWLLSGGVVVLIAAAVVTITLVTARPSLERIAADCGGRSAGILADDTGIVISTEYDVDGLTCVLPKVFSDHAHQYAVTMMVDAGAQASDTIDGREVSVLKMAGQSVVFIGN